MCARNAEVEIREICHGMLHFEFSLQARYNVLGDIFAFALCTRAQLVNVQLRIRASECAFADEEFATDTQPIEKGIGASFQFGMRIKRYRTGHRRSWIGNERPEQVFHPPISQCQPKLCQFATMALTVRNAALRV